MTDCQNITSMLIVYLRALQQNINSKMPQLLKEHLADCTACSKLIDDKRLRSSFLVYYSNTESETKKSIETAPSNILTNQIWKFRYVSSENVGYCLVNSRILPDRKNGQDMVRVIPIFCGPLREEIADTDILLKSCEWRPGMPALLETWNECLIKTSQLEEFVQNASQKTVKAIKDQHKSAETNEIVKAFRTSEIIRSKEFAQRPALSSPMNVKTYSTPLLSGIKLIVKLAGRAVKDLYPTITPCWSVAEESSNYMAATESSTHSKLWYQWFKSALAADGSLPFDIQKLPDNSFKLKHTSQKLFTASFYHNKKLTMKIVSNNKGTATFSSAELNDLPTSTVTRVKIQELST